MLAVVVVVVVVGRRESGAACVPYGTKLHSDSRRAGIPAVGRPRPQFPPPMGAESRCTLEHDGRRIVGTAYFESDHILVRGASERLKLPLAKLTKLEARGDALLLAHAGHALVLHLAPGTATTWLSKIRNPRSLLDKLGVKEGMKVVVLGVQDEEFLTQLEQRVGAVRTRTSAKTDIIVFGAESVEALERLGALRATLVPNGAIWVVHRKGKAATLRDVEVFAAGRRAGLVDNKVAAFSPTHTAERLVIPLSQR